MAVLDFLVAGAREIAVRSLELHARQQDSGDATFSPIPTISPVTGSPSPTLTPSNTPSISPDDNGFKDNRDSNTTSPLLFFVALGFGVVFTNLWIIVGVKYCFRYNARNRQMRMAEEGDPVALENMPRPHRRRREKKLMTMDEVNEKFPMLKYKNWVSARAQEGLPTMGGVSAPPSRANSVRSVEAIAPELPSKERTSDDQRPTSSASIRNKADEATLGETAKDAARDVQGGKKDDTRDPTEVGQTSGTTVEGERSNLQRVESEDDHDDEHINPALPPECMGTSGDACAICIESLEDDDDVRGLTCGHAFHAVCLDPWLTSRRACCPLCKADYYTPKPRPPPTDANGNPHDNMTFNEMGRSNSRLNLPTAPQSAWYTIRGRGRRFLPAGLRSDTPPTPQEIQRARDRRRAAQSVTRLQTQPAVNTASETTESRSTNIFSNFRPNLPRIRLPQFPQLRRNNQTEGQTPVASGANDAVTPSQLESGTRPAVSA